MENLDPKSIASGNSNDCVKVAVNIRPLITTELLVGCTDCITLSPGEPQVQIGSHVFTFDHVFGSIGSPSKIFDECVTPLVDAFFHGYNATVLAYGQTGSGKTYTMGTNYTGEHNSGGIIPKVMDTIFKRVEETGSTMEFLIRVSFIEIFKEEVFDLLDPNPPAFRNEIVSSAKLTATPKMPIQIRETSAGGITVAGVTEAEVKTKEEMASFLARGSQSRATGSTNMNSQSSRSHAIFTILMEQRKVTTAFHDSVSDDMGDDILSSKFHLVDLAGSERAKRTGADGLRLKEGIHINKGLLALGNVISALGDEKKRKEGGHVPYRDSKLTRLLQDSLGGNSKTVMIACVSPADTNAEETLNTLKYANRARNIQNKAIVNRDPVTAEMQRMRSQIEQLQTELLCFRSEGAPFDVTHILQNKISALQTSNAGLRKELQETQGTCKHYARRAMDVQIEKDKLISKIDLARKGKSWDEIDSGEEVQDTDISKAYISRIQELEEELSHLKGLDKSKQCHLLDCFDLVDGFQTKDTFMPSIRDELDEAEKEERHSSLQEKFDKELQELDKKLEQKEAEMRSFSGSDAAVLQHYEKKILELEQEKKTLQKEIEALRQKLSNISSSSDDNVHNLKEEYLHKLNVLEAQVSELKRKQDGQAQLLRQKQKSDEAAKRLQEEIHKIKIQKVQLQHKIKQESEQFRAWKVSREKEVLQLRKEGRRNEYEMHKLLALNQRQKMVLQRKTEEASMATKRLKEVLESRKSSSREMLWNRNGANFQALAQAIEHELEVTVRVHDVRLKYEKQLEVKAGIANELALLKEESAQFKQNNMRGCLQKMSPGARNSRIIALENMLAATATTVVNMASHLSEAEERERLFGGKGRWNQLHSLVEAKNLLSHLFNLASSSRCQLREKELENGEKDATITELKEKVVELTGSVRQLETQIADMHQQKKLMEFSKTRSFQAINLEGHTYDLRKVQNPRMSQAFDIDNEDMDTSDSELSEQSDTEWEASGYKFSRKLWPRKRTSKSGIRRTITPTSGDNNAKSQEASLFSDAMVSMSICCSCSKKSLCKTVKCECRHSGAACSASCGCMPSKCTNRQVDAKDEIQESKEVMVNDEGDVVGATDVEEEMDSKLASHGAMLLQSAFTQKPEETDDHNCNRKPLCDIGNTLVSSEAPKQQNQKRKFVKKSIVQLIPAPPRSSSHPENGAESRHLPDISKFSSNSSVALPQAMEGSTDVKPLMESTVTGKDALERRKEDSSSFRNVTERE